MFFNLIAFVMKQYKNKLFVYRFFMAIFQNYHWIFRQIHCNYDKNKTKRLRYLYIFTKCKKAHKHSLGINEPLEAY